MPVVVLAPHGSASSVGCCPPAEAVAQRPSRVRLAGAGAVASAFDADEEGADPSTRWSGRPSDVKPGVHWILEPTADGAAYRLRPARGWFEFGRPELRADGGGGGSGSAAAAAAGAPPRSLEAGEAELLCESDLRKTFASRWEAILERRTARGYGQASRGAILGSLHGEEVSEETTDMLQRLQTKAAHPVVALKALEGVEVEQQVAAASAAAAAEDPAAACLEEEARLKDATGVTKERKKRLKALRRAAKAVDQAEEEEVPDTANALFLLKSQRGEGLWDFADNEEHSDDEEDNFDFDEQLRGPDADNQEAVMADDEEDADTVKCGFLKTTHGEEIEHLLRAFEQDVVVCASAGDVSAYGLGEEAVEDEGALSEGEACARRQISQQETFEGSLPARRQRRVLPASVPPGSKQMGRAEALASRNAKRRTETSEAAGAAAATRAAAAKRPRPAVPPFAPASSSSAPAPGAPCSAPRRRGGGGAAAAAASRGAPAGASATPSSGPAASGPDADAAELRQRVIDILRRRGGQCTLSGTVAALGLQQRRSALWGLAVAVLKEVAVPERVPREDRPVLMLKLEHWGDSDGPPLPEGSSWCYVDASGGPVRLRAEAECYGEDSAQRFRVRFGGLSDSGRGGEGGEGGEATATGQAEGDAWLPLSKAPATCPGSSLLLPAAPAA